MAQRRSGESLRMVQLFALLAEAVARENRLEDILKAYAEHLPELLAFDRCSISIMTDNLRNSWHLRRGRPIKEIVRQSSHGAWSMVKRVMESLVPIIRSDMGRGEKLFSEEPDIVRSGTRSMIVYPLIIDHRAIGTIDIESDRRHAYTEEDLPMMAVIAAQIAIALDKAQVTSRQAERLAETGSQLISAGKLATVGQLATVLAHEIKNRFNVILLGAQFLKSTLVKDRFTTESVSDADRVLASIIGAVAQGNQLMVDFLRFARPVPPKLEPVCLKSLIEEALRLARRPDVRVVREFPPHVPLALGDATQLGQVFINLILNAVDAMPHGGTLTVRARGAGPQIEVQVADTGVGIDPVNLPRIFHPFFTTKKTGTGLGMSISKTIIENLGGSIEVRSQVGTGTTFTVYLPSSECVRRAA